MKPRLLAADFIGSTLLVIAIRAQAGDFLNGQRIYAAKMCNLCHTLAGESGPMAALPEAKMSRFDLTDQEIADLTVSLRLR